MAGYFRQCDQRVGEQVARRASPIYWHDPAMLAHGEVQKWFYTQNPDDPHIAKARAERQKFLDAEVSPVSGAPVERSAEDWTVALLAHAAGRDLDIVGVAEVNQDWVFESYEVSQKYVVMIGIAHDYDELSHLPSGRGGAEVVRQYARGTKVVKELTRWFREQGHDASHHGGPLAGPMLLVSTNGPEIGADDFCVNCQVCSKACPPDAILPEKNWVRGEKRWYVDFEKCLPHFNENFGCGICVAACPLSRPGVGPGLVAKLAKRRARLG